MCRWRGRSCPTILVGPCLCSSTWSCISWWCCGCITTCLKTRRYVSISLGPFFSRLTVSCLSSAVVEEDGADSAAVPLLWSHILIVTRWSGDANFRLRFHPKLFPPILPRNYVRFVVAASLSSTYPTGKRAAGLRILSGWLISVPLWNNFCLLFSTLTVRGAPSIQSLNPIPPPPEKCFPPELSLDAAVFFVLFYFVFSNSSSG